MSQTKNERKNDEQKNAPELPIGRFLKSKSLGGDRVILEVERSTVPFTRFPNIGV